MIMLGDFNASIGYEALPEVTQPFNNGELLTNISSMNKLQINNTIFDHKPPYKCNVTDTREQQSMINYNEQILTTILVIGHTRA